MHTNSFWNSLIEEVIPIHHPPNQQGAYIRQVLPDASPNLIWVWQEGLAVQAAGQWKALPMLSLSGLLTGKKQYAASPLAQGVIIKLKPWALSLLKDHSALESIDRSILLPNHYVPTPPMPMTERSFTAQINASWLQPLFADCFWAKAADPAMIKAIQAIQRSQPGPRIKALAQQAAQCTRQFERRFKAATGLTPKQFVRNVRIERARTHLALGHSLLDVTYSCGYFDQTHFTREFKHISGVTPSTFRRYTMSHFY